jgi:hypothetical protein
MGRRIAEPEAAKRPGLLTQERFVQHLPAFGWQLRDPSKKMSLGFGLIGLAGFRTDYPQDNGSILFAQPPSGFGRIFTDFRETKIPVAMALQLTPKLAVGASLNVYLGEFAVAPLPYKVFDTDANGNRWYLKGRADQPVCDRRSVRLRIRPHRS